MAEEVHNPSVQLPIALSWSIPIGFVMGVIFLLPILFTLPDVPTLLAGTWGDSLPFLLYSRFFIYTVSSGQPIGVLFELIMGSKGGGFGMVSSLLQHPSSNLWLPSFFKWLIGESTNSRLPCEQPDRLFSLRYWHVLCHFHLLRGLPSYLEFRTR